MSTFCSAPRHCSFIFFACIYFLKSRHHWVEGNLAARGEGSLNCIKCGKPCGSSSALQDFRCSWCYGVVYSAFLRTSQSLKVHSECKPHAAEECNLGQLRDLVIAPSMLYCKANIYQVIVILLLFFLMFSRFPPQLKSR